MRSMALALVSLTLCLASPGEEFRPREFTNKFLLVLEFEAGELKTAASKWGKEELPITGRATICSVLGKMKGMLSIHLLGVGSRYKLVPGEDKAMRLGRSLHSVDLHLDRTLLTCSSEEHQHLLLAQLSYYLPLIMNEIKTAKELSFFE